MKYNSTLSPITLEYKAECASNIVHTGHSVQVNIKSGSTITGGRLKNEYSLAQFHLHWGSQVGSGSEHTVNGAAAEAEIHFVHWNSKKYKTIKESLQHSDGLVVLAALIKQNDSKSNNNQAHEIIKHFPNQWKIGHEYPLQSKRPNPGGTPFRKNELLQA